MLVWNCGTNSKIPPACSSALIYCLFSGFYVSLLFDLEQLLLAKKNSGRTYALGLRILEHMETAIDSLF